MKLYIATPVNARKEQGMTNKLAAARKRVEELKEIIGADERFNGCTLVSSFDVNKDESVTEAVAMGNCIRAVMECDAIYLDHDWQSSLGCNLECQVALIYGKDIYEHDDL